MRNGLQSKRWRTRAFAFAFSFAVIGAVVGYFFHIAGDEMFAHEYARFRAVQIGMQEADVIRLLGEPYKVYSRADAPAQYHVTGYAFQPREITNKVFIYVSAEPIAYIYFNHQNRVEEVFIGGS